MILNLVTFVLLSLASILSMLLFVLVGVAFLTMLERKVLSYIQSRKGPNKVGVGGGVFQPFSDAIKLLNKEKMFVYKSNIWVYYLSPVMIMMFMLMNWAILPWITNIYFMNYSMLLLFCILSMCGYMIMLSGWSSNSIYSLIGSVRFIAQSISYEVSFILIMYCLMIMSESYSLCSVMKWQMYIWNLVLLMPVGLIFFVSVLAELNRSPMDLVEGESELVSGFNTEYFSGAFALIFLGEYGMIMFLSFVLTLMFTSLYMTFWFIWVFVVVVLLVIYMRSILPRVRYDELMFMCWKMILPVVLNYILFLFGVKFLLSFISC